MSMRVSIATCLITLLSVSVASAQPRKTTQADFLVGQITTKSLSRLTIDLGYVHGFQQGHRFAVFRSESLAWSPIGVVEVSGIGSSSSRVKSISGVKPAKGDLVVVAYSTLGTVTEKRRTDFYTTRRILLRQYQNGYDTGSVRTNARQLSTQKKNGRRWYRQGEESGLRLLYGSTRDAYASDKVRNLVSQCELIAELQQNVPGALKSLSPRWSRVLPEITGYSEPASKPAQANGEQAADEEADFANTAGRNLQPFVEREFGNEPKALREVYAIILGSLDAQPPTSKSSFIRSRLAKSQFPHVARQPDTVRRLEEFLLTIQ